MKMDMNITIPTKAYNRRTHQEEGAEHLIPWMTELYTQEGIMPATIYDSIKSWVNGEKYKAYILNDIPMI